MKTIAHTGKAVINTKETVNILQYNHMMLQKTLSLGTTAVGIMRTEQLLTAKLSKDFRINLNNSNASDLLS